MRASVLQTTIFFLAMGFLPLTAAAQQGATWVGGELGDPSGIVVRPSAQGETALEFLAAWDLDEFFFLNAHRIREAPIREARPLYFLYGPGLFVGLQDGPETEAVVGVSGKLGVGYRGNGFRVYFALTPRLSLAPDTDGQVGGGLGVLFRL